MAVANFIRSGSPSQGRGVKVWLTVSVCKAHIHNLAYVRSAAYIPHGHSNKRKRYSTIFPDSGVHINKKLYLLLLKDVCSTIFLQFLLY